MSGMSYLPVSAAEWAASNVDDVVAKLQAAVDVMSEVKWPTLLHTASTRRADVLFSS